MKLINQIFEWMMSQIPERKDYVDVTTLEKLNECKQEKEQLSHEVAELTKEINQLKKLVPKKNESEEFWNNKWNRAPITYRAREDSIYFDIRNFITVPDQTLIDVIESKNLKGNSDNETMYKILCWVIDNVKYVTDDKQFGFIEHWDFPAEVLHRKKADCEGGANLIVSLGRAAGIPAYKLKNLCGNVPGGGHSCAIYLDEDRGIWVDLDWCYAPMKLKIFQRPKASELKYLNQTKWQKIWFTFNDINSWAEQDLDFVRGETNEK